MASSRVKVIRGAFAVAEYIAPAFAGRLAFELFCRTPGRNTLSDREKRAILRARPFMTEARHHMLEAHCGSVMAHEFRPDPEMRRSGTVLVIHGWGSRTEYVKAPIQAFRDAGYRVVSLDLPGHGASPGRRLTMASAIEAVRATAEWFGPFEAVIGHSFGGAVAANAVAGSIVRIPPLDAARLVLIAAPSSLPAILDDFGNSLHLGQRSRAALAGRIERVVGRPLAEFTGTQQLASTRIPTLVIHAPDDREVAADHARDYAAAGRHVQLHWAPGLGHRRILADRNVLIEALGFVAPHSVQLQ